MRELVLVSVITVTLNDRDGLIKTAESIGNQDYPNFQHIIVDGGSTDGTVAWLKTYTPSYELNASSERDKGIFDAMNKGVAKSTGELIVFMNSGDIFTEHGVISKVAEKYAQSPFSWGYGAMRYMDGRSRIVGVTAQYPHKQRRLELGLAFAPHQATYVNRDFFLRQGGFDVDFAYAADQEFAMRAGRLASPTVWAEHSADFLTGGIHSQSTYWHRERLYHRMRVKNSACVAGSTSVDRVYAECMALYRESRERLGLLLRKSSIKDR